MIWSQVRLRAFSVVCSVVSNNSITEIFISVLLSIWMSRVLNWLCNWLEVHKLHSCCFFLSLLAATSHVSYSLSASVLSFVHAKRKRRPLRCLLAILYFVSSTVQCSHSTVACNLICKSYAKWKSQLKTRTSAQMF